MDKKQVAIIGVGLTGLVAAQQLSKAKYDVKVFEKEKHPGGRMRTKTINGWQIDHGFQVLLSAYPYLNKYVNIDRFDLVQLDAGATIFEGRKALVIGDPTRDLSFLLPTIFSSVGSLKDKFLIVKLNRYVKRKSIDQIFQLENQTTLKFLKAFGFSDRMIRSFFKPFYAGIFLENELRTSARMFLFVFKMFGEGSAVIPRGGIGKLAEQLRDDMKEVDFAFGTTVQRIDEGKVFTQDHEEHFDVIINTNPFFDPKHDGQWKGSFTYYFEHEGKPLIDAPRIGLIPDEDKLINNIFYADLVQKDSQNSKCLLSVTVIETNRMNEQALTKQVHQEVELLLDRKVHYVHHFELPHSLPDIDHPKNSIDIDPQGNTFHVGDYVMNGSQNAACKLAGEIAAFLNNKEF